jgi:hypothetical protein
MGNRIGGRRKSGVEERFTRPQGLYDHKDIDQKKLRKLILEAKLAPCYPGADDAAPGGGDLEECPICFLVSTRGEISPHPHAPPISASAASAAAPSAVAGMPDHGPRLETWTEGGRFRRGGYWVHWRLTLLDLRVPLPRFCY